jgi:hypothetical protein
MISKFPLLFYLFHLAPWHVPSEKCIVGMQSTYVPGAGRATLFVNHKYLHGSYTQTIGPGLTLRESSLYAPVVLAKNTTLLTGLTYRQNHVSWDTQGTVSAGSSVLHHHKESTALLRFQLQLTGSDLAPQWQFRELYRVNENWSLGAGWDYLPLRPDPLTLQCIYTHENLQLVAEIQGQRTALGVTFRKNNLFLQLSVATGVISPSTTMLFAR